MDWKFWYFIDKVNARIQLLRKVASFGSSQEEMVHLWKVFCLSVLDQSCVVWGSGLTKENEDDLERTQNTFAKLVLGDSYTTYFEALKTLQLDPLNLRREKLTLGFVTMRFNFKCDFFSNYNDYTWLWRKQIVKGKA